MRSVELGGRTVTFRLRRSARRRIRIVVSRDRSVEVRAPPRVGEAIILEAVRVKAAWLNRTLARMEALPPRPPPLQYHNGETHLFLGRPYRLHVTEGPAGWAHLRGGCLCVTLRGPAEAVRVKRAVARWYLRRATALFTRLMKKCGATGAFHGIPSAELTLRNMRTRWGSCTAKGRVTLNVRLVQTPIRCVEYVLMHELCHRVHLNHSRAFYQLLANCMPDWQERKRVLNEMALPPAERV